MSHTPNAEHLDLTSLFSQYLERQVSAHAQGLGFAEPGDEVLPYDAVPIQPVDPQLAWNEALLAMKVQAGTKADLSVPPEWPQLVNKQEPAVALAFCLGNFPQMVRYLQPLLGGDVVALRQAPRQPLAVAGLDNWAAEQTDPLARLFAAGIFRLAGRFEDAERLLECDVPENLQLVRDNERAALAWHRGDAEKALQLWQAMPPSSVTLFNRGMACLFLGDKAQAAVHLKAAVAGLPEAGAWHHLGQLYLTLCA